VVDGKEAGATEPAGDVHFQATTRGGRQFDYVLEGKAIYKTTAKRGRIGALILAGDSGHSETSSSATPHHRRGAPRELAVRERARRHRHWDDPARPCPTVRTTLAPGAHEIEIVRRAAGA
jgi:hypothetical protein